MACTCFDEVAPSDLVSYGAKFGPMFSTIVVETIGGSEQRIAQWQFPRYKGEIPYHQRRPEQMQALIAFFHARKGKLRGFRFLDAFDYDTIDKSTGLDVAQPMLALTATTYQLQKAYVSGPVSGLRNILKPISDTLGDTAATAASSSVKVFNGVTAVGGWTLDCSSGIVTFTSAPGYTPTWTGQFHVPVRFDTDAMEIDYSGINADWSVPIIELLGAC